MADHLDSWARPIRPDSRHVRRKVGVAGHILPCRTWIPPPDTLKYIIILNLYSQCINFRPIKNDLNAIDRDYSSDLAFHLKDIVDIRTIFEFKANSTEIFEDCLRVRFSCLRTSRRDERMDTRRTMARAKINAIIHSSLSIMILTFIFAVDCINFDSEKCGRKPRSKSENFQGCK